MPLYEYRCSGCGLSTEVIQSHKDDPLTVCESCGGALQKQVSSPAFQFKGSGWYVSDYGKGNPGAGEKPKEGPAEGGKTEGAKTEGGSPSDKASEKPSEKPSDKSSEKSADKSADKPASKPSSGASEGSAPKDGGKSSG